ncbi:MAG TPA: hypothetical protein ACFYD6_00465 [Candidatus Brocadiia bacterium]|nr:hypothetical protein [Planctomycetota bacterium]MBI4006979.1 hypothetical protein [Planctomycetota bacterium]MDO8094067.1 hypothetical protein [Candidatus Brocadiales bacterium]
MHFVAYFEDEVICGKPLGEPETGWNNLPDKPVYKLEYVNPYGNNVVLEGFEEYNHFIEVIQQMGGKPYLARIFLMGANNGKVTVHEIMLDDAHLGQVITKKCARGTEYDGEPSWGWRRGN